MHLALKKIFDEDQRDCLKQPADGTRAYKELKILNKKRRNLVKAIIESTYDPTGGDYFHACIIYLHGDSPKDFHVAYQHGLKSIDLNFIEAKKYTASAYDRWLMYQGKPQKFGLQYVPDGVSIRLWDVDPATTDQERAAWDVAPLKALIENVEEASKRIDMSKISMEHKPQWLKDTIKRWNQQ